MSRNSKLILSKNIKLDKQYKEVLNYSELQMLELLNSEEHLVNRDDKFSYLRENSNVISTGFSYAECLQANYIAFTNPDYSNKWFFAFVDDVIYISDKVTEIHFTIDVMSTWFNKVDVEQCFVIREHTMDDTLGKNTLPEDLETGDYISANLQPTIKGYNDICFTVSTTKQWFSTYSISNENLPTGVYYTGFETINGVEDFIKELDNRTGSSSITAVFVCPKDFFSNWITTAEMSITGKISTTVNCNLTSELIELDRVNYIGDNYVPKNNKLNCFPYSFLQVSNHSGNVINYKWEDFNLLSLSPSTKYRFRIGCTLAPSCSGYVYPINYKNILANYDEGIPFGKFPVGGWNTDVYTNWLTQNAVNIPLQVASGLISTGAGVITGNAVGVASGVISIANSLTSIYQHSLEPPQAKGNVNVGDFNFSNSFLNMEFKRITIKNEYAKIIDEYFTRFGYKTNLTKVPNINGRTYFNYVQIADSEVIGYGEVPNKYMDEINNIFRRGVTIWHDHSNIGDYTVNNSIVTP